VLETFKAGLTVGLIATPREDFETCRAGDEIAVALERSREDDYDFLPVTAGNSGKIIGLIELLPFRRKVKPLGTVEEIMDPLSEENLIGADASILTFVRNADSQRCRLVISGPEIGGLVSLSDLQQLPVRAALFGMVTHLEMVMKEWIQRKFSRDEWRQFLSPDRNAKLNERMKQAKGVFIDDPLLYTEFGDKTTIINKSLDPGEKSRKTAKKNFEQIRSLRDDLAHANKYAATREAATEVCKTVRSMEEWIERLSA
jgi:hypothetical protein